MHLVQRSPWRLAQSFIFDSRNEASGGRLEILNDGKGVWRCRTIFSGTEVCPGEIRITRASAR